MKLEFKRKRSLFKALFTYDCEECEMLGFGHQMGLN